MELARELYITNELVIVIVNEAADAITVYLALAPCMIGQSIAKIGTHSHKS